MIDKQMVIFFIALIIVIVLLWPNLIDKKAIINYFQQKIVIRQAEE